jgi:hypothetical protein
MLITRFHLPMVFAASVLAASAACAATQTSYFTQNAAGRWIARSHSKPASDSLAEARVTCQSPGKVSVGITWFAESGDWTASDTYRSVKGSFFERRIKFAQFPTEVRVTKASPTSPPKVEYIGDDLAAGPDNRPEVVEIVTFGSPKEFPFRLPDCARALYRPFSK